MKDKIREDAPYILPFEELKSYLEDFKVDSNANHTRIAFLDVDDRLGVFCRSDFIILYDITDNKPVMVTERVSRRNYSLFEWWRLKRQLREKSKHLHQEYGYDIAIDIKKDKIDYTHYKNEKLNKLLSKEH